MKRGGVWPELVEVARNAMPDSKGIDDVSDSGPHRKLWHLRAFSAWMKQQWLSRWIMSSREWEGTSGTG